MAVERGAKGTKAANPREYFAELAARAPDTKLRAISGTCRFDIQGAGSWMVTMTDGKVTVRESAAGAKADTIVVCSVSDFMHIIHGELNPIAAALQGRMQATGSLALLQLLQKRIFL